MVPMMQIRDRSIILYPLPDPGAYSQKRSDNMRAVRKSRYSGTMAQGGRKRMTKALTLMAQAVKPRWIESPVTGRVVHHHLSFVTLTIADQENISARDAYDWLLAPFLQWLRDTKKVQCYVWKGELQKRGQIHYHIVFPDFIHWREIRVKWNALQKKAGLLQDFAKRHGHFNPPSTEIKEKKGDTMKYLVKDIIKEMAKTVDAWEVEIRTEIKKEVETGQLDLGTGVDFDYWFEREVNERLENKVKLNGKVWDCSDNLSRAKYFTIQATHYHFDRMEEMESSLILKQEDWFSIITFTGEGPPGILDEFETHEMEAHFYSILN